jgi:hypothetical protein
VLTAACGGTAGTGADADRMLQVGSCFVIGAAGAVVPTPCDVRNDGVVMAEVEDAPLCDLLGTDGVSAFAVVDGRTFCLRDAKDATP